MCKVYIVNLSDEERSTLRESVRKGKLSARRLTRSHILLRAAEGATDRSIAESLHVHVSTVERTRRRFVEGGLDRALTDRPRPGAPRRLDVKQGAYLMALACSQPPDGREHWTLKLLSDRLVQLDITDRISYETVRQELKRGTLSPG